MAGQVKHAQIFSSIRPDWRLFKLLASLASKNTDSLIGGVAKVLEDEGIHLGDSTAAAEAAAGRGRPAHQAQAIRGGGGRHRLRPPRRRRAGGLRHRAERGHLRARLRGGGSHGRHRRHAAPRRRPGQRPRAAAGESLAPARKHLLFDVSRGRARHHRRDAGDRHDRAGRGRRPHAAAGPRRDAGRRRRGGHRRHGVLPAEGVAKS